MSELHGYERQGSGLMHTEELAALRTRVAELEAALREARDRFMSAPVTQLPCGPDGAWERVYSVSLTDADLAKIDQALNGERS